MHYSDNPGHVRAEFFKPGGKWYMTDVLDMSKYYNEIRPEEAVWFALVDYWRRRGSEMSENFIVVVQEPYHKGPYPVCFTPEGIRRFKPVEKRFKSGESNDLLG